MSLDIDEFVSLIKSLRKSLQRTLVSEVIGLNCHSNDVEKDNYNDDNNDNNDKYDYDSSGTVNRMKLIRIM